MNVTNDVTVTHADGRQDKYKSVRPRYHELGMRLDGVDGYTIIFAAQAKRIHVSDPTVHMSQREWDRTSLREQAQFDHVHIDSECKKKRAGERCE